MSYNVTADDGNSAAYCIDNKNSEYVKANLISYLEEYYELSIEQEDDSYDVIKLVDKNKDEILMSVYFYYKGPELLPFE